MNDLFGEPVNDAPKLTKFGKPKRNETPRGYAGTPGKGPAGHFCKDCRHISRKHMGKTYLKCFLMIAFGLVDSRPIFAPIHPLASTGPASSRSTRRQHHTKPANIFTLSIDNLLSLEQTQPSVWKI